MKTYQSLKQQVFEANLDLVKKSLVILTWGNVSQIDRAAGVFAIKPSGVDYAKMTPEDIVVVDLEGRTVEGRLNPSSDMPTHLELYKAAESIGGIVHTHSTFASAYAQAGADIPCYGTTHADYFYGAVPCTPALTKEQIADGYERNTGLVIVETFFHKNLDYEAMPAVLVKNHACFTWGKDASKAVENAYVLEQVAHMAMLTRRVSPAAAAAPQELCDKHYFRKHGKNAYYGQK